MSTKAQREALSKAIDKVISWELKIERTYTDLTRTRDEEEKRRERFQWNLDDARHEMNLLIAAL